MNRLAIYLNRHIDGVVYSAPNILSAKSADRSILRYYPRLVAEPENTMDIRKLVRFSYQLAQKSIALPLIVQGSRASKTANDIGTGLIVSTSRLNKIQEIDVRQRLVRVQAGVKFGELQKALSLHAMHLPLVGDNQETIGELVARNASAYNNTEASSILDFIQNIELVLSDGSLIECGTKSGLKLKSKKKQQDFEGDIYHQVDELIRENTDLLSSLSNKDKAGYSNVAKMKSGKINLANLIVGADNTLAIATEYILRIEPVFDAPTRVAVVCCNANDYVRSTKILKELKFTDQISYDTELFNEVENTGKTSQFFRKASDDGYIIIASAKDDSGLVRKRKISKLKKNLAKSLRIIIEDSNNTKDFDALVLNLRAYLNDSTKNTQHLPLIDGVYIPERHQKKFLDSITRMSATENVKLAVVSRPDFNTFTVRPNATLENSEGRSYIAKFLRKYMGLIIECEGNPCGEQSEGRFLTIFYNRYRSAKQVELDQKIKQIFDPFDILNPGVKHEADPRLILKHFRASYNDDIISEL